MNTPRLFHVVSACCIIALLTVGLFAAVPGAGAGDPKFAAVPERMKEFIAKHEIAGAVTLVANREKVLTIDTVGQADVAGDRPMQADTMFWIASMTKPITGTAIMMLQEEGKLSVDDPVGKYIPELGELKTADGKAHVITLKHLLTHSSGMPDLSNDEAKTAHTLADLVPFSAKKTLQFEPGSQWRYCQSGINTLGRVIEVTSGQSYPEFLQTRLFTPLGMKDTTFYPTKEQVARLVKSYKLADGKLEAVPTPFLAGHDPSLHDYYPAANGGLFSTASDYGTFLRMVLNQGTLNGKQYLKPESVKQMTTVQSGDLKTGFTPGNGWGLGWCVVREPQGVSQALSPGSCGHGGAYGTQAWIDPVKGVAYVLMVQRANFPNSDASDVRKAFQDAAAAALAK
ncbi:MAG: estB 3 [Phycisphaerales bacterium]|jgi:CubicO group peptidase (beta-lactamase class C family)|nr:estB 3 [Phycisphaerales bacterium]